MGGSVSVAPSVPVAVAVGSGTVSVGETVIVGVEVGCGTDVWVGVEVPGGMPGAVGEAGTGLAVSVGEVVRLAVGVIVGTLGTHRYCPAIMRLEEPRQFASRSMGTVTPKARLRLKSVSPRTTR